jgi:AhpD family alkylhydroperoxidase
MKRRLVAHQANPEAYKTMLQMEQFIKDSGLDPKLYELIKIRASQLNGCSFCLDMHTRDLRKMGETEQRIYLISVWRETDIYNEVEKAVLELTEALTELPKNGLPDAVYDNVRQHFDERHFVTLVMAVNTINSWNRIGVATGMIPERRDG